MDSTWQDLLDHLCHGCTQDHHIEILHKLVINCPEATVDFTEDPWKIASLVTPQHAVRKMWNDRNGVKRLVSVYLFAQPKIQSVVRS